MRFYTELCSNEYGNFPTYSFAKKKKKEKPVYEVCMLLQ